MGAADLSGRIDLEYQSSMLEQVSRTFALTIPQLPPRLRQSVGNAYLLCRIADTVEDDPQLSGSAKRSFEERFIEVVKGNHDAEQFGRDVAPLLALSVPAAERELVRNSARVLAITHALTPAEQSAVQRCIEVMADGMAWFQERRRSGLRDQAELDRYCYVVAGCVGEMLTELFCQHSSEMAQRRERLLQLAVSFGQGLQMTNILKDVWEDRERGMCWLPGEMLAGHGVDLAALADGHSSEGFDVAMRDLIGTAALHLERALEYTLLVPAREAGIRRFCLWALGMALLTLRRLQRRLDYRKGSQVKISRRAVRATVLVTSACARSDAVLRLLFRLVRSGLPPAPQGVVARLALQDGGEGLGHTAPLGH